MYGPRQTDSISLITFTSYLSRIYFAICINYMMAVNQFSERQYSSKFEAFFDLNIIPQHSKIEELREFV